jgi:hypothetical protein
MALKRKTDIHIYPRTGDKRKEGDKVEKRYVAWDQFGYHQAGG